MQIAFQEIIRLLKGIGGSGLAPNGKYTSIPILKNTPGVSSIPAGVASWSAAGVTGVPSVGGVTLTPGQTIRGGGYPGRTLAQQIIISLGSGDSVLISYDLLS